jgi:hypothetical protein
MRFLIIFGRSLLETLNIDGALPSGEKAIGFCPDRVVPHDRAVPVLPKGQLRIQYLAL